MKYLYNDRKRKLTDRKNIIPTYAGKAKKSFSLAMAYN